MPRSSTTAGVILAAALSVWPAGCSRQPDPSTTIAKALKEANLVDVRVNWDHDARVAHLEGTVDSPPDRQRAEDVASSAVGTAGRVLNEVTIKGLNDKTAGELDGSIERALKQMLKSDPILRDRDVDFSVHNGAVTVKGEVRTSAEKAKVTEIVRAAPGVKDMVNALEIRQKD